MHSPYKNLSTMLTFASIGSILVHLLPLQEYQLGV